MGEAGARERIRIRDVWEQGCPSRFGAIMPVIRGGREGAGPGPAGKGERYG